MRCRGRGPQLAFLITSLAALSQASKRDRLQHVLRLPTGGDAASRSSRSLGFREFPSRGTLLQATAPSGIQAFHRKPRQQSTMLKDVPENSRPLLAGGLFPASQLLRACGEARNAGLMPAGERAEDAPTRPARRRGAGPKAVARSARSCPPSTATCANAGRRRVHRRPQDDLDATRCRRSEGLVQHLSTRLPPAFHSGRFPCRCSRVVALAQ